MDINEKIVHCLDSIETKVDGVKIKMLYTLRGESRGIVKWLTFLGSFFSPSNLAIQEEW